ncbi:hypothetical protein ACFL2V_00080 [Pseudomonadota bacterium]
MNDVASDSGQVIHDLGALLASVERLLTTDTAQSAPEIAEVLGAEAQLNDAIDFLSSLIEQLKTRLAELRPSLIHIGALSGVMALLEPFVTAIGQLVSAVNVASENSGLNSFVTVTEPVSTAVELGGNALGKGQQILGVAPTVDDVDNLISKIDGLMLALIELKAE